MMLEPLISTIKTLKGRIASYGTSLRQNETRTRAALIDPLLTALGWDVSDPALVTPEYGGGGGWADYALAGVGIQPAAVIEAKKLGSIVENHLDQAVTYCIREGIAYAGVTDGSHWQLYRTFDPVPLAEKLVLDVSIADLPPHEAGLKLLMLWRENLETGRPVASNQPVLNSSNQPQVSEQSRVPVYPSPNPQSVQAISSNSAIPAGVTTRRAAPPAPPWVIQSNPEISAGVTAQAGWVSLSSISSASVGKKPREIRFSDGETRSIRAWSHVLAEAADWLVRTGKLTSQQCPVGRESGSRFLVNTIPVHKKGSAFTRPRTISKGLFLDTNHTAFDCVDLAKFLLQELGVAPESVEVRLE